MQLQHRLRGGLSNRPQIKYKIVSKRGASRESRDVVLVIRSVISGVVPPARVSGVERDRGRIDPAYNRGASRRRLPSLQRGERCRQVLRRGPRAVGENGGRAERRRAARVRLRSRTPAAGDQQAVGEQRGSARGQACAARPACSHGVRRR